MASATDINIPAGQGNAIREVHRAKQQAFDLKRRAAARKRKGKKKKKEESPQRFIQARGGREKSTNSEEAGQHGTSSKRRGTLLDVVI